MLSIARRAMNKLALWMVYVGMVLVISTGVYAGGTYHHSDPVFSPSADQTKINHRALVVRYSPEHHHYHLSYK
jgi:hypothetical protein